MFAGNCAMLDICDNANKMCISCTSWITGEKRDWFEPKEGVGPVAITFYDEKKSIVEKEEEKDKELIIEGTDIGKKQPTYEGRWCEATK